MCKRVYYASGLVLGMLAAASADADSKGQAIRLFDRLAGVPIRLNDPRPAQMTAALNAGDPMKAAAIATAEASFYNLTVRHFATPMSNKEEDYQRPLNDFIATVIGVARDDRDARSLLNGDFVYQGDPAKINTPITFQKTAFTLSSDPIALIGNNHYAQMEAQRADLRDTLVPVPQRGYGGAAFTTATDGTITFTAPITLPDTAGLLTTRQWSEEHIDMGTNRRPIQYALQVFLCKHNTETRDTSATDERVRQDVDRMPGGVAATFQTSCRGCHAPMDAMAGSFAYFEHDNNNFIKYTAGKVQSKMLKNGSVFKAGYKTIDDSWLNYYNKNQNTSFGWDGRRPDGQRGEGGRQSSRQQPGLRLMHGAKDVL
jgi:hypothetical protein